MLTDMILEEEFEKSEEPWYHPQDLEHDLHLAAELGKTLLDRNHELEQALQQMYSNNQEQLQEIEYLTKQVELLRQMNDQHARVYEQLDTAARDLEQGNHRLIQDNRLAQQKIHSLTETIEGLQTHMEELQSQVDNLKTSQADREKRELAEHRRSLGAQSVSCLKELYDLHHDRHLAHSSLHVDGLWPPPASFYDRDENHQDPEEQNVALKRSIQTLKSQIAGERSRREAAEKESELTARENRGLEQRLTLLAGSQTRQRELEAEVEQLRLRWRADNNSVRRPDQLLLPDTVFFASDEKPGPGQSEEERADKDEEQRRYSRQRCNSDSVLRATNPDEIRRGHDQLCIRRAEAVKQRGISLLNEVDAQYSALQVKYDELLRRCQQASDELSHKAVQTSSTPLPVIRARRRLSSSAALSDLTVVLEDVQQPEYKTLFKEIFTCIQKTKEDLSENRRPVRKSDAHLAAK